MAQAAEAIGAAHAAGIVHRDLKPANVFLAASPQGTSVKILDFGLAKFLAIDELSSDATLTRKGRIVGTPAYMSPEQITGVSLDVRADVYAAGVVLFEMIADLRPFDYERRSELLRAHLFEKPPEMHAVRPGLTVDPELESIVRKALAKDPAERFANAGAMLRALEALKGVPASVSRVGMSRRERRMRDFREQLADAVDDYAEFYRIADGANDSAFVQLAEHAPPLLR